MTLFRLIVFKFFILTALVQTTLAIHLEAPQEISEHVLAYLNEAGIKNENTILRVSFAKITQCNFFTLKLIDKNNGKVIKEIERCSNDFPNAALQNAIFEIFGRQTNGTENIGLSGNKKTVLIGAGFTVAGILLYFSKPPKPVYGGYNYTISEDKK